MECPLERSSRTGRLDGRPSLPRQATNERFSAHIASDRPADRPSIDYVCARPAEAGAIRPSERTSVEFFGKKNDQSPLIFYRTANETLPFHEEGNAIVSTAPKRFRLPEIVLGPCREGAPSPTLKMHKYHESAWPPVAHFTAHHPQLF